MRRQKSTLKVPAESRLRNLLRKEAGMLVREHGLLPPASMSALEDLAVKLIRKLELSDEYLDFAIVLTGNETWREIVSATPFNRRLLLLPQCLKNNSRCKGSLDEMGLTCAGCKACVIDNILTEAEKLGYTTLVAEGTTVAIGLVEEGSVDAVIGVSCMSTLQRSFNQVRDAAVPVIGIPLLYDGCSNTDIDCRWLLQEIRANGGNFDAEPLSVSLLTTRVRDYFTDLNINHFFLGKGRTESLAKEMISMGGRRMRPLMTLLSFLAYSAKNDEKTLASLAMIIECFHKASLIHDDIEDNSESRYDRDTLHKKYGIPVAINTGDYLIGKGYMLLSELPLGDETIASCLRLLSSAHINLTRGQGSDIMWDPEDISFTTRKALEIFRYKTCEAIRAALLLGAVAGKAPEKDIRVLEDFSDSFGLAFQIKDDINEFEEKSKTEKISDYPFMVALLNEKLLSEKRKKYIHSGIHRDTQKFREFAEQFDLLPEVKNILRTYIDKSCEQLDRLQNLKLRLSLYGILGKTFKSDNPDG